VERYQILFVFGLLVQAVVVVNTTICLVLKGSTVDKNFDDGRAQTIAKTACC
jgi:hypothetical protein